jgi:transposase
MLDKKLLDTIGGWKGYRVERVEWPDKEARTLSVYLKATAKVMHCEQCGGRCDQVHETTVRRVRDLPFLEFRVVLHVPRRRVWCPRCNGPRLEKLDWLGRYQRVTNRFAEAIEQLLRSSNIQAVASFFGLSWHTVKALDKMQLKAKLAEPDWATVRYLAMDEFALHKGHRYATVVVELLSRQAVHLKELLAANEPLLCVYVLRDELKHLWFYRREAWARQAWQQWLDQAQQSGIAALQTFAQRLQAYWHGILAHCRHPLNTSIVEGINNTIKVIKRRAYGYRDEEYFFLKIRSVFPGNPR